MYVTYCRQYLDSGGGKAPWTYRTPEGASITGTNNTTWAVLYCPDLAGMFQCLLNVEFFVSFVSESNFLFKYVLRTLFALQSKW